MGNKGRQKRAGLKKYYKNCGLKLQKVRTNVPRVKEPLPPPSPPRELTEEELAQMELEKEKQELKKKLQLITVEIVGSLESRELRARPAKRLNSDEEPYSDDDSKPNKKSKLLQLLLENGEDTIATQDNGEANVSRQNDDTKPQVGPDGLVVKKRGRPSKTGKPAAQVQLPKEKKLKNRKPNQPASRVQLPKEKILQMRKPNQACRIIARVYHYLKQEYEFLKANTDKSCDLSFLANTLKRTADATGFTEPMVKNILEAEEIRRQGLREEAERLHKAEQRKERRLQREKQNTAKRKNNKVIKKSNSEVTKDNSEISSDMAIVNSDALETSGNVNSDMATGINSDALANSGNVNSDMAVTINSDLLIDIVKTEVLDEEYGDRPVTGIQQSIKPAIAVTITTPTVRLAPSGDKPSNELTHSTENGCLEPEVYAPRITHPEERERQEAKFAAGILRALLEREEDPLS